MTQPVMKRTCGRVLALDPIDDEQVLVCDNPVTQTINCVCGECEPWRTCDEHAPLCDPFAICELGDDD